MTKPRLTGEELVFIALLLVIAFGIRAHLVEAIPPFNDESLHIGRAEKVFTDRDTALTPYKTLVYFWVGAFQAERINSVFLGRTVIGLFALLGISGAYALGKMLFDRWAGLIAMTLAVFSPFMIFFDRLLLSDPMTSALGILMLWMSLRLVRLHDCGRYCPLAIGTGVLGFLVVMAKTIGLPLLAMPILAVLLYGQGNEPENWQWSTLKTWVIQRLRAYQDRLITVYITFILCFVPSTIHLIERTLTGKYVTIVNNNLVLGLAEDKSPPEILLQNLETLWNVNWILQSPFLWLLMLVGMVLLLRFRPKAGAFIGTGIVLAWSMSIVLGAELSTRYMMAGTLPSFVMVAGAISALNAEMQKRTMNIPIKAISSGLLAIWIVVFSLPFINKAWTEPENLTLPTRDKWEYFTNFSSGYALVDAGADFYTLEISEPSGRVNVYGLVGSCHQIRLYVVNARTEDDGPIWLTCPAFGWSGEYLTDVALDIQNRLVTESSVYLLLEPEIPFFDAEDLRPYWQWEEIERYQRPHGGMEVVLYRLYPHETIPQDTP